jgi:hypothetical protein
MREVIKALWRLVHKTWHVCPVQAASTPLPGIRLE